MLRFAFAMALLTGCRGERDEAPPSPPPPTTTSLAAAAVPKLPASPDGTQELRAIDAEVAQWRADPRQSVMLVRTLLARAAITGTATDYVDAVAASQRAIEAAPGDPDAWRARVQALSRVHRFADARAALAKLQALAKHPSEWEDLGATLDEATGHPELATPIREATAKLLVQPETLAVLGGNLALRGKLDEAIALIPQQVAAVANPSAPLFAWLYFQWGRLYEQKGEIARARDLYAEARRRMPPYLEATVHLVAAMKATGQDPSAVLADGAAQQPHPELLAVAGRTAEATRAWEAYLAVLPEAFADHAARFYLGPGADPARALVLATANLANRDTGEARSLVVEAALAAGDVTAACKVVDPLITGLRPQQFIAWRALAACGRTADADKLASVLGIH